MGRRSRYSIYTIATKKKYLCRLREGHKKTGSIGSLELSLLYDTRVLIIRDHTTFKTKRRSGTRGEMLGTKNVVVKDKIIATICSLA